MYRELDLFKNLDGSFIDVYYQGHINHDPTDQEEIIASRLPENAHIWIAECVDKNMD